MEAESHSALRSRYDTTPHRPLDHSTNRLETVPIGHGNIGPTTEACHGIPQLSGKCSNSMSSKDPTHVDSPRSLPLELIHTNQTGSVCLVHFVGKITKSLAALRLIQ